MNLDLRRHTQVWLGLAEREVFPYLRAFSKRARTGIDVGAAEGEYALFYLSLPGIKHVLAFDPSERFPIEVPANLALNGFGQDRRATLINKYVGDHDDDRYVTLDSVASELEGPCVIKIDVEGAEGAVLQGSRKLLDRQDVFWIIETHSAQSERDCERILKSEELATTVIGNAWWRVVLPELRPLPHNRWLTGWRGNLQLT